MPFIPHTDTDIRDMLDAIGVANIEALFDEIPASLRAKPLTGIPEAMNEMALGRFMQERATQDGKPINFIGAGAYEHHIPAAVWAIVSRGEFYSAYTPYQAEASQGTLQLLYEYQTMIASLTAMEVSNASLYDGASALGEACLMAVRAHRKSKSARILVPTSVNPTYMQVAQVVAGNQNIKFEPTAFQSGTGTLGVAALDQYKGQDITALVIQQPNFFGQLEDVDALTDWAHANGTMVIAVVNPMSLALLKPPGQWGQKGVDIVVGEGQPLGIPLSLGGPYLGLFATKKELIRKIAGRLVGETVDQDGKRGYVLTLTAREQHIRREKATSNICTNQGLMALSSAIYMSLLGKHGFRRVAELCYQKAHYTAKEIAAIPGFSVCMDRPFFHEFMVCCPQPVEQINTHLLDHGILGGYDLGKDYPALKQNMLVAVTEMNTKEDIDIFVDVLREMSNG